MWPDYLNVNLLGLCFDIAGAVVLVKGLLGNPGTVKSAVIDAGMTGRPTITEALVVERAESWADAIIGAPLLVFGFVLQALSDRYPQGAAPWSAFIVGTIVTVLLLKAWQYMRRPLRDHRAFRIAMSGEKELGALQELCLIAPALGRSIQPVKTGME
jgi:hypothetical protein